MSNPNDPWSQRPEEQPDQPTEGFGAPTESDGGGSAPTESYGGSSAPTGQQQYTADPYQAYGDHAPTEAYGAYPGYGNAGHGDPNQAYSQQGYPNQGYYQQGGYPPPSNPTMAYPTYEGQPYPGEVPPLEQQPGGPKKNKTGLIVAGIVVVALAAVTGIALLLAGGDSDDSATQASNGAAPTQVLPPSATGRPSPSASPSEPSAPSGFPAIPDLGDTFGEVGFAMGTIKQNDGSTLVIEDMIDGESTTIHTDSSTEVLTTSGNQVSDLKVGDQVAAQGDRNSDGTFQAKVLVSMALPGLGEFGDFGGFGR